MGWLDVAAEPMIVSVPGMDKAVTGSCTPWT